MRLNNRNHFKLRMVELRIAAWHWLHRLHWVQQ